MQTKREYAAGLGLAIAGARGRMSREAHEAIKTAEANGVVFSDASPMKVASTPKEKTAKPVTVGTAPDTAVLSMVGEFLMGDQLEEKYFGFDSKEKKVTVNARQVCMNSGYSLVGCPCGLSHRVLVGSLETVTVTKKGG